MVRGFGLNLIGGIANAGLGFGFTLAITRALPVREVGVLYQVIGLFSILIVVTQLGAGGTIVKTVSEYRALGRAGEVSDAIRAAVVPTAAVSVGAAVVLFVFARSLATGIVKDGSVEHATTYLRILAPFIPFGSVFAVLLAGTRGAGTMLPTVLLDYVAKPALRVLVAVIALVVALSPAVLGALWAMPLAAGCLIAAFAVARLVRQTRSRSFPSRQDVDRMGVAREFWAFTMPQWLSDVFQLAVLWLDVVLVGALGSAKAAGVYAAISRLATIGTIGLTALLLVLGPEFSALLARGDLTRLRMMYRRATLWLAVGSVPVFVLSATFAHVIVRIFGGGYGSGEAALTILAISMAALVVTGPSSLTLLMGGRSRLLLGNAAVCFTANLALNVLLIPSFSMTGAAVAWGITVVLGNLLSVVQIYRIWGVRPVDRRLVSVCVSAGICFGAVGFAVMRVTASDFLALLMTAGLGAVLYASFIWRSREMLELPTSLPQPWFASQRTRVRRPR